MSFHLKLTHRFCWYLFWNMGGNRTAHLAVRVGLFAHCLCVFTSQQFQGLNQNKPLFSPLRKENQHFHLNKKCNVYSSQEYFPHAWLIYSSCMCTLAVLNYLALLENISEMLAHLVSREEWMFVCV